MYSSKPRDNGLNIPKKSRKDKKLSKLINNSESDSGEESEHELVYYMEDRVKLMKEVLKIIKPKKIKSMAPNCMKQMKIEEINSMLLEELLGISKKRLRYIFEGKNLDEESSTDEDKPVDVISLDDISDDDFVVISDDDDKNSKKKKRKKIKEEPKDKPKKIKKEKTDKEKNKGKGKQSTTDKEPMGEENLMSVLELLELQARARAIRSQLDLENKRKREEQERLELEKTQKTKEHDEDEIIIEVPKEVEIVITSSDSEDEEAKSRATTSKIENVSGNSTSVNLLNNKQDTNGNDSHKECFPGSITINSQIENNTNKKGEKSVNDSNEIENSTPQDGSSNSKEQDKCNEEEKEEEEVVSESESHKQNTLGRIIDLANTSNSTNKPEDNGEEEGVYSSSSTSDSSDNLQIIMLREKRRKKRCSEKSPPSKVSHASVDCGKDTEGSLHINDKNCLDLHSEKTDDNDENNSAKDNIEESHLQKNKSKLDEVIADFMQTQPPLVGKTEDILKLEKAKKNEEKVKQGKEKRIKNLKNKLQSYKKDVEVESSVEILENIVIKPRTVADAECKVQVPEDHDDLVINVDQDDLDCMICD